MIKKFLIFICLFLIFLTIGWIFWVQDLQYSQPTPFPENYISVLPGTYIFDTKLPFSDQKPTLLHFFNPDCPCSKFNLDHLKELIRKYDKQVDFIAVLQAKNKVDAKKKFESLDIPIKYVVDTDEDIAKKCGVYSTPQAVILTPQKKIFYRGNYNKSRYCTLPNSNFAQMAIDSLLDGKQGVTFPEIAFTSYGCELPGNQVPKSFNLFIPF